MDVCLIRYQQVNSGWLLTEYGWGALTRIILVISGVGTIAIGCFEWLDSRHTEAYAPSLGVSAGFPTMITSVRMQKKQCWYKMINCELRHLSTDDKLWVAPFYNKCFAPMSTRNMFTRIQDQRFVEKEWAKSKFSFFAAVESPPHFPEVIRSAYPVRAQACSIAPAPIATKPMRFSIHIYPRPPETDALSGFIYKPRSIIEHFGLWFESR